MLKLNTTDLIKRARQLADLENSSFISWEENFMAMNAAFNAVYQKAINHNERFWLKEAYLAAPITGSNESRYTLPADFFQLYAINDVKTNRVLLRMSLNEPETELRYDIVNNELVIYGNRFADLKIRYFPTPKTLVVPGDDVKFEMPDLSSISEKAIDIYGTLLVWAGSELFNGTPVITINTYELTTGAAREYYLRWYQHPSEDFISGTVNSVIAGRNGIAISITTDSAQMLFLNLKKSYNYSDLPCVKAEYIGNAFLTPGKDITFINNHHFVFADSKYPYREASQDTSIHFNNIDVVGVVMKDSAIIKYINRATQNKIDYYNMDLDTAETIFTFYDEVKLKYLLCNNGIERVISESGVISSLDGEQIFTHSGIGINKIDFDTGYGLSEKSDNGDLIIHSILTATELDYPNNFFYEMLAYELAIQYKSKQNADCNGLIALYQKAEDQFYDTITRDDFQPTRIQNVY